MPIPPAAEGLNGGGGGGGDQPTVSAVYDVESGDIIVTRISGPSLMDVAQAELYVKDDYPDAFYNFTTFDNRYSTVPETYLRNVSADELRVLRPYINYFGYEPGHVLDVKYIDLYGAEGERMGRTGALEIAVDTMGEGDDITLSFDADNQQIVATPGAGVDFSDIDSVNLWQPGNSYGANFTYDSGTGNILIDPPSEVLGQTINVAEFQVDNAVKYRALGDFYVGVPVPVITGVSSPSIMQIQIDGTDLTAFRVFDVQTVNNGSFAIYNDTVLDPEAYDTEWEIASIGDTQIIINGENVNYGGAVITSIDVYDTETFANLIQSFDVDPDVRIRPVVSLNTVNSPAQNQINMLAGTGNGDNFAGRAAVRLTGPVVNATFYNQDLPGAFPPSEGDIIQWADSQVLITAPGLAAQTITKGEVLDEDGNVLGFKDVNFFVKFPYTIDAYMEPDDVTVTIVGDPPVDFSTITALRFDPNAPGSDITLGTDYWMQLDTGLIQVLDSTLLQGQTFDGIAFIDGTGAVVFNWDGTLVVPG